LHQPAIRKTVSEIQSTFEETFSVASVDLDEGLGQLVH